MTQRRPVRRTLLPMLAILVLMPAGAVARDVLGVFHRWGAFHDADQGRCFAIAQPLAGGWARSPWRPFASVGYWPRRDLRGQVSFRLSHQLAPGTQATLAIGNRRFRLVGGEADAWAADRQADVAILAAMRSATIMSVSGQANSGGRFTDRYGLRGAATAIDAAALGCAKLR